MITRANPHSQPSTFFWALVFLGSYHAIYALYLNPIFEYFHYYYHDRSAWLYLMTYGLALFPLLLKKKELTPASVGAAIIYVMCFAPGILTMLFMWNQSLQSLLASMVLISLGMACLFAACGRVKLPAARAVVQSDSHYVHPKIRTAVLVLTLVSGLVVLIDNWSHMRFVGFDDVYELRSEANVASSNALAGYLTLWLSLCFIPYYVVVGLMERSRSAFLLSVLLSLLVYMSSGAKSTLLMPVTIWAFHWLVRSGKDFLSQLLKMFSVLLLLMLLLDIPELELVKSLVIMRTLSTGGWTLTTYYEYFSQNGYTYFSHIGFVNAITGWYQYDQYSLGQLIGLEYIKSAEANFNANFWASDGYAAMGIVGLIPATLGVVICLRLVNYFGRRHDPLFVGFWFAGFWVALLNSPVSTSLLSGGGLVIMLFLMWSDRLRSSEQRGAVSRGAGAVAV